jgi:tRNA(fMet)-specific endonuclease VapC
VSKALLDTDIYSEVLKAINPTVTANATGYRRQHSILTLSAVTLMEIVRGLRKKQTPRRLQNFLAAVALEQVIPFDQTAAEWTGSIAGELEWIGQPIGIADTMIAATALARGLELVTGNTRHVAWGRENSVRRVPAGRDRGCGPSTRRSTGRTAPPSPSPAAGLRPPGSSPPRRACAVAGASPRPSCPATPRR